VLGAELKHTQEEAADADDEHFKAKQWAVEN